MARPLEFEYVVESENPKRDYDRLLSARPSEAARRTLREARALDMSRLREDSKESQGEHR